MIDDFLNKLSLEIPSERMTIRKNDNIFSQGKSIRNLYYILEGKIKLVRNTVEGEEIIMHVAYSGELLAEASLFSDQYHCSAVADSESVVLSYNKAELMSHLEEYPATMKYLLKIFAQQVKDLRVISEIKNIHSAKERILAYLKNEMRDSKRINLSISLKDTAYKIGLAHETFYRELKKLEQAGMLSRDGRHIELL